MPLSGELSDLSLAELIEFFCNQRKTGRLEVNYPVGAGYFYLKSGAVIHAHFGDLRGIDAVYYALTQPNASFTFTPTLEVSEHTINQPWTSVVLEGLRRMDEGVASLQPSPGSLGKAPAVVQQPASDTVTAPKPTVRVKASNTSSTASTADVQAFGVLLTSSETGSFARRRWSPVMAVAAVVLLILVVGVPWVLYTRKKAATLATEVNAAPAIEPTPVTVPTPDENQLEPLAPDASAAATNEATEANRQREARARERAKALERSAADSAANPAVAPNSGANAPSASANKRATVQVTYDENGRVTAASGGDATALRIARQKRFPPGKPGSATITIPIN